jgi:hypothetical protein
MVVAWGKINFAGLNQINGRFLVGSQTLEYQGTDDRAAQRSGHAIPFNGRACV